MKYTDGTEMKIGDRVLISGKYHGVIVADIDNGRYSDATPKEEWEHLVSGVMIDTDFGGLVHYQQESMDGETIELDSQQ